MKKNETKKFFGKSVWMALMSLLMATVFTACSLPSTDVFDELVKDTPKTEDTADDEEEKEDDESKEESEDVPLKLLFVDRYGGIDDNPLITEVEDGESYQWTGDIEEIYLCYEKKVKSVSGNLFVDYEGDAIQDHFCILSFIPGKEDSEGYPKELIVTATYEDGETETITVDIVYESSFLESTNVSSDTQLADCIRTAIITCMLDPAIVSSPDYMEPVSADLVSLLDYAGPTFKEGFEECIGYTAEECISRLQSQDASGFYIYVEPTRIKVVVTGSHADANGGADPIIVE